MALHPDLLDLAACPVDGGPLVTIDGSVGLFNPRSARRYPVDDGIPLLLADRAEPVDASTAERLRPFAATTPAGNDAAGGPGRDAPAARAESGLGKGKIFPVESAGQLDTPLRRFIKSPRRLARQTVRGPAERVLELGPGPGYFSRELARLVPQGHLALCDLQPGMLERARTKLAGAPASFVAGDAQALPYRTGGFDAAVLVTVLGEVPDSSRCLTELHRVLRPGGRLVISEMAGDPDYIPVRRLRAMAHSRGFTFVHRRGWYLNYTAVFERPAGEGGSPP